MEVRGHYVPSTFHVQQNESKARIRDSCVHVPVGFHSVLLSE